MKNVENKLQIEIDQYDEAFEAGIAFAKRWIKREFELPKMSDNESLWDCSGDEPLKCSEDVLVKTKKDEYSVGNIDENGHWYTESYINEDEIVYWKYIE